MTNVNDILNAIGQAQREAERVPGLEAQVRSLSSESEDRRAVIAKREEHILSLKEDISTLTSKLRSTEVERDDASFRVLEAEDRVTSMLRTFKEILAAGEGIVAQVEEGFLTRGQMQSQIAGLQGNVKEAEDALQQKQADLSQAEIESKEREQEALKWHTEVMRLTLNPTPTAPVEALSFPPSGSGGDQQSVLETEAGYTWPDPSKFSGFAPLTKDEREREATAYSPPAMPEVVHNPEAKDKAFEQASTHAAPSATPSGDYHWDPALGLYVRP